MTRIALLLTLGLLVGCADAPLPVAEADDVYASIRRAELERARVRPGSDGESGNETTERSVRKSQL